ncbi:hypothetical protein N7501_008462 [Penicillium viridicatum]|nr:hypothetical protein N7501_008462 [Penicillium viridicatum]
MRVAPTRFPHCNFDTSPPELDAYDFFHAFTILRWAHTVLSLRETPSPKIYQHYRTPQTRWSLGMRFRLRRGATISASLENEPSVIAWALVKCCISLLASHASNFSMFDSQWSLAKLKKNKEANIQFPGIDGLVEKYAHKI